MGWYQLTTVSNTQCQLPRGLKSPSHTPPSPGSKSSSNAAAAVVIAAAAVVAATAAASVAVTTARATQKSVIKFETALESRLLSAV